MAKGYEPEVRYYVGIHQKGDEKSRYVIRTHDGFNWITENFIDATHFESVESAAEAVKFIKEYNAVRASTLNFVARRIICAVDGFDIGTIIGGEEDVQVV
jgi:hypothetical protein